MQNALQNNRKIFGSVYTLVMMSAYSANGLYNAVKNPLCCMHWSALWIRKQGIRVKRSHTNLTLSSVKTSGLPKTKQSREYLDSGNHKIREKNKVATPLFLFAGIAESFLKG